MPSIQNLLLGEKSDTPCSLITANDMLTPLQTNSLRSSSVTSKFLCNSQKFQQCKYMYPVYYIKYVSCRLWLPIAKHHGYNR